MHMGRGACRFAAGPEGHLAVVYSVKNVTLYAGSGLTAGGDAGCRELPELREIVHGFSFAVARIPEIIVGTSGRAIMAKAAGRMRDAHLAGAHGNRRAV